MTAGRFRQELHAFLPPTTTPPLPRPHSLPPVLNSPGHADGRRRPRRPSEGGRSPFDDFFGPGQLSMSQLQRFNITFCQNRRLGLPLFDVTTSSDLAPRLQSTSSSSISAVTDPLSS